MNKGFCK